MFGHYQRKKGSVYGDMCECTWAMGGSPRHWGDSLVLTADDAIMLLPQASERGLPNRPP